MDDLAIRPAIADDAPAISELVQHTVRISNGRDYPPQAIEMIVANFAPAKVGQLSSSLTARGFYERLGYRLIELEEHDGVSTFLMAKTLS